MQHHSSVSVDVTDEYSVVMDFMIDGCVFFFKQVYLCSPLDG